MKQNASWLKLTLILATIGGVSYWVYATQFPGIFMGMRKQLSLMISSILVGTVLMPSGCGKLSQFDSSQLEKIPTTNIEESAINPAPLNIQTHHLSFQLPNNHHYTGVFLFEDSIHDYEKVAEKTPAIVGTFFPFKYQGHAIAYDAKATELNSIVEHGAIPFITWEPWDPSLNTPVSILPDILKGHYDSFLEDCAKNLADLEGPVLIRWGHEMQGNWYPWAGNPTQYIQAYRYIVDAFRAAGAHNVMWLFSPNHNDGGTGQDFQDYFPGTQYVDAVCISGYNFGDTQNWSYWRGFNTIYESAVYTVNKEWGLPILLDIGSAESGGNKADWIQDVQEELADNPVYSSVRSLVWFHIKKEANWRIDSSLEALQAYQELNDSMISTPKLTPVYR